jgi:hypothetical protein
MPPESMLLPSTPNATCGVSRESISSSITWNSCKEFAGKVINKETKDFNRKNRLSVGNQLADELI